MELLNVQMKVAGEYALHEEKIPEVAVAMGRICLVQELADILEHLTSSLIDWLRIGDAAEQESATDCNHSFEVPAVRKEKLVGDSCCRHWEGYKFPQEHCRNKSSLLRLAR